MPSSVAEPVLFGRSRCEDVKAKTLLLLFSLFLYEMEPEAGEKKVPGAEAGQKRTGPATLVWRIRIILIRIRIQDVKKFATDPG